MKFDRHLKAKAHAVGDAVWVFCRIIPKGGTHKLIRAWRGPHKIDNRCATRRTPLCARHGSKGSFREIKEAYTCPLGLGSTSALWARPERSHHS